MSKKIDNKSEELLNLKNIYKTTLKNGVIIYILPDYFLDFDVTIKFDNYGSNLDKYYNIFGFQHLLEHCIFFNYKNLNIVSNASTTPSFMTIDFNIPDKNFNIKNLLHYWLFSDNNYTKIDLSRKLTLEEIQQYINELDNEYEYRKILNIPWQLQTLLLSDEQAHYFGGNKNTFKDKEKLIQKKLLNPLPISPDEIVIFIKKSKNSFYNDIKNIFNNLNKIVKKQISYNIIPEIIFNKIIQINSYDTNSLIFIINKDILDYNFLYYFKTLYPFMNFELLTYTHYNYIYFNFFNINDLYIFYYILQTQNYDLLALNNYKKNIKLCLDVFHLNSYPVELLNISNETYLNIFNKYKKQIINFFELLTTLIRNKKFIVNTTKGYIFNKETDKTLEKYYMTDANFLDEYFYSYHFNNFNIIDYIDNILLMNNKQNFQKIYCKSICNKIYFKKKNILYYNSILDQYMNNCLHRQIFSNNFKLSFSTYIYFLIVYFTNTNYITLDDCIKDSLINNSKIYIKNINEHDIILSNKIFKIKCEYDFFLVILKLSQKELKEINYIIPNLELYLKTKGLCYYLESCIVNFKKFGILFIYSNVKSNIFKLILENILFFFKSNYFNINTDIILSYKNKLKDFSELKKTIKCTF